MDLITQVLAKVFDAFKAKNPKLAAIILFILGCVLYAANNGLPELIGTDLSKYTEWLVFVLAALQGSRTSQILHQEKETK
jgi:multisubunit Na+/H+ antiporter MnhC subunit